MNAIEVTHLRRTFKSYVGVIKRTAKEVVGVDDMSFSVEDGELFGLLGPNGAGKTTTVEMFEGMNVPDEGTVEVLGRRWGRHDVELRRRVGIPYIQDLGASVNGTQKK